MEKAQGMNNKMVQSNILVGYSPSSLRVRRRVSRGLRLGVVLKRDVRSVRRDRVVRRVRRDVRAHLVVLSPQTRRHLLVAVHVGEGKRRRRTRSPLCPLHALHKSMK